jgi:hypothetical protein
MIQYGREHGHAQWYDEMDRLKTAYREALADNDQKGMEDAIRKFRAEGATDEQVKNLKETSKESTPERLF